MLFIDGVLSWCTDIADRERVPTHSFFLSYFRSFKNNNHCKLQKQNHNRDKKWKYGGRDASIQKTNEGMTRVNQASTSSPVKLGEKLGLLNNMSVDFQPAFPSHVLFFHFPLSSCSWLSPSLLRGLVSQASEYRAPLADIETSKRSGRQDGVGHWLHYYFCFLSVSFGSHFRS